MLESKILVLVTSILTKHTSGQPVPVGRLVFVSAWPPLAAFQTAGGQPSSCKASACGTTTWVAGVMACGSLAVPVGWEKEDMELWGKSEFYGFNDGFSVV